MLTCLFISVVFCLSKVNGRQFTSFWTKQHRQLFYDHKLETCHDVSDCNINIKTTNNGFVNNVKVEHVRGGSAVETSSTNDDERYSRQVYTLGKQAHSLIRTSTVYIDGPPQSGLVYECAKNLALSGVRNIVLVTTPIDNFDTTAVSGHEHWYHNPELDDLGRTYQRGARTEVFGDADVEVSSATLLTEYIQRLNPSIIVTQMERSTLTNVGDSNMDGTTRNTGTVLLCIDRPISTAVSLNHLARQQQWAFVASETAGIFGKVFCDFGSDFVVEDQDGETPLNTPLDHIKVGNNGNIIIHCVDGDRHDVSKGDRIQFHYRNGEKSNFLCTVVDVQTPFRFVALLELDDKTENLVEIVATLNADVSSFSRLKSTTAVAFDSLDSVMKAAYSKESIFTACDLDKSYDITRRWASLSCFLALAEFIKEEKRLPSYTDKDYFTSLVARFWPSNDIDDSATKHIEVFLRTCAAKFPPLQAVFGAISAQEVLKAITRFYYPVHQLLLYDCDEVIICNEDRSLQGFESTKESPGLRYIIGNKVVDKLQAAKVFVVGSGAIGCEILKNLASMGVGTLNEGKVVVTDMDTIEKSNLSRQLLFRDGDIGKFKSTAAREAVLRCCPIMRIEAHSCKVGEVETNNPFDELFWSNGVEIVLNALDNVDARLFMDKQCVTNKKALIDAGTMGPKGNVQVIVPDQSESYASSADPPEPSIPLCTIKNFPYSIAHTIQWARDLFEGLYQRRPQQANDFLDNLQKMSSDDVAAAFIQDKGADSSIEIANELLEDLSADSTNECDDVQAQRHKALLWATKLAFKFYHTEPDELLKKHPLTSVDDEGLPFWSGSRRPPRSLTFCLSSTDKDQLAVNESFVEFVRNGARLRVESIKVEMQNERDSDFTPAEAKEACSAYFKQNKSVQNENLENSSDFNGDVQLAREKLRNIGQSKRRMKTIDFEKDDEHNGHVAFVNAASNLRAMVYGIPVVDAMETRRVAGKIVPAMISTTAFVSALSCTELVKVIQNANLQRHRNAFINLALPFFAFTVPLPAEELPGLNGNHYTIWDQLSITESKKSAEAGGITLKLLLKQIKKLASTNPKNVNVVSISTGPYMLYANFLHDDDEDVLLSSLWEQVKDAISSSDTFDEGNSRETVNYVSDVNLNDSYIDLTVVVEDFATGEEVELPPLRVHRFRQ